MKSYRLLVTLIVNALSAIHFVKNVENAEIKVSLFFSILEIITYNILDKNFLFFYGLNIFQE